MAQHKVYKVSQYETCLFKFDRPVKMVFFFETLLWKTEKRPDWKNSIFQKVQVSWMGAKNVQNEKVVKVIKTKIRVCGQNFRVVRESM